MSETVRLKNIHSRRNFPHTPVCYFCSIPTEEYHLVYYDILITGDSKNYFDRKYTEVFSEDNLKREFARVVCYTCAPTLEEAQERVNDIASFKKL